MSQGNDMVIREVEDQHIGFKRLSLDHGPQVEVHVVNHTHGYPVRLRWVELDARHTLALAVIVVNESSGCHVGGVDLAASCCLLVSEHLEVVLEHIDDLIALKSLLNSESNSIDELVQLLLELLGSFDLLLSLFSSLASAAVPNEVLGVILYRLVHRSTKVGLGVYLLHLVSGLEAYFKHFFVLTTVGDALDL